MNEQQTRGLYVPTAESMAFRAHFVLALPGLTLCAFDPADRDPDRAGGQHQVQQAPRVLPRSVPCYCCDAVPELYLGAAWGTEFGGRRFVEIERIPEPYREPEERLGDWGEIYTPVKAHDVERKRQVRVW
eukprot:1462006-Rhodomonas_salina.1